MTREKKRSLACLLAALSLGAAAVIDSPADSATASSAAFATQISNDMTGRNEGVPHGVPSSYAWSRGPFIEMGNNARGWRALEGWGAVYVASQGNPAINTRVNIRRMQTWFLSAGTGGWRMAQSTTTPDGAAYMEDFSGNANRPADVRMEPDGTISVTAGGGYNYHFYPAIRAAIDPGDIGGIVTLFEARLIVGNPALPDDRAAAKYLCGSGADYYPALSGGWPGNLTYNPGVAGGRLKYVTIPWRSFAMTTLPAAALAKNPPPIDLTGIEP